VERVGVGVIGLGEVAQVIHLPILETLADRYRIAAICDVSPTLLQAMGDRYGVPAQARHADYRELVTRDDVDAVLVLNSDEYHADSVIAACEAGKDVLVEKPMCLTLTEAEAIVRARDEAGVRVMVAYMRRFAPAFVEAVDEVKRLERINYVRVRDIIGRNRLIIDQVHTVLRPNDVPVELAADRAERAKRLVGEAIGEAPPELIRAYRLLCGLSSHDLSAMRELLGFPSGVVSATQWNGGSFMLVVFAYDGYRAILETGIDDQRRFDAHIEVYAPT
jgi:predicted dehydrogenase